MLFIRQGKTKFVVYYHRPHGVSDFLKKFHISDAIQHNMIDDDCTLNPPLSALIRGWSLGDLAV